MLEDCVLHITPLKMRRRQSVILVTEAGLEEGELLVWE